MPLDFWQFVWNWLDIIEWNLLNLLMIFVWIPVNSLVLNFEFRLNAFPTQLFFSGCQKGLSFWIRKIHKNVWKVSHTPKERNSLDNKSCQRKTCLSGLTHDLSFHGIHCIQSLSDVSMDKKDFFFFQRKIPICDVYS